MLKIFSILLWILVCVQSFNSNRGSAMYQNAVYSSHNHNIKGYYR